jgi:molybdopterin-synthase adenylyltransferase
MSRRVQLRIPQHLWAPLWDAVRRPGTHEPVVFGLVSHGETNERTLVMVRDLIFPAPTAFESAANHGAKWSGAYNIALLNEALGRGLGIVIFHHHPGSGRVRFSEDDEQSARQLLPAYQMVIPGRPHGSVILGETSTAAFILLPDARDFIEHFQLRFFSESMTTLPRLEANGADFLHRRRHLANDVVSRSLLRNTVIAVVGLSGGGSQLTAQLAAHGVGEIIGIDEQRITRDNTLATDEFGWGDVLLRRRKTAAVRSKVRRVNRNVRFTAVNALVPEGVALEALRRADIIVGCVNNLNARADIQEIAWRYCIPYIDIGLGLYPLHAEDEMSEIAAISGNVFGAVPGGPCLWCTGFLSDQKLQQEVGGTNRSYMRGKLRNHEKPESGVYVTSFNGVLAGLAANDVLQLILGYAPMLPVRRQYDGLSGTVLEVEVKKNPTCPKCAAVLAAGDPLWG